MKTSKTTSRLIAAAVIISLMGAFSVANADAPAPPTVPLRDRPLPEIVTYFANENGLDPSVALSVMDCESHGIQSTVGDYGRSLGIFQIQRGTWARFTKEMGVTLDISSPYDQARVATWAMANGHAREWTTYVALVNGGSYTFWYKLGKKTTTVYCKKVVSV